MKRSLIIAVFTLILIPTAVLLLNAENVTLKLEEVPLVGEKITKMELEVAWAEQHSCSDLSPQIKVLNVPPPVIQFTVYLKDRNAPSFFHGGGLVSKRYNKIIKEGELKHYAGPCPPTGETHQYMWRVYGLDVDGRVIAYGEKMLLYPSE